MSADGDKGVDPMAIVYCDEAGNTGANLLDMEQPFFILASNDFSVGETLLQFFSGHRSE